MEYITGYVVVKNEEEYIEACLSSIVGICDHIIVVDNGSTDSTVEIASSFASVEVLVDNRSWRDVGEDTVRNDGLRMCKGKFILIIDGDEVLFDGQEDRIREYLTDDGIGALWFNAVEFYGDHYHIQDIWRNERLDGDGVIVPGFGRQATHGRPLIYRNHTDLKFIANPDFRWGLHCNIRDTASPPVILRTTDLWNAHYGNCKCNEKLYEKCIFYYDGMADEEHMCRTEEWQSTIDPDNPQHYHPDQAVRPYYGRPPSYMKGHPERYHRIVTEIDDEGKARIVAHSNAPLPTEIIIGTPGECGRPEYTYDDPVIDIELKRVANEYTVIKALDYYTSTVELCMIHPNVFVMVNENIPNNPQLTRDARDRIHNIIYPNARHFIAVSESVRNTLIIEGVSPNRISVINFWGCDLTYWEDLHYSDLRKDYVKGMYGVAANSHLVLYVGRLDWEKGIDYLLEAIPNMPEGIEYILVGAGDIEPFLDTAGPRIDGYKDLVHPIGRVGPGDLLDLYNTADVLILPSIPTNHWVEQFGRVLTEAMACGLPCVATNIGGPLDIIVDGVTGFLIRPADAPEITEKLTTIIYNREMATGMEDSGRKRVIDMFSDDAVNDATLRCIERNMWECMNYDRKVTWES